MLEFKQFNENNTISKKATSMLIEMSTAEAKSYLKNAIDLATDDQIDQMLKALELPALSEKMKKVFEAKHLERFIGTSAFDEFIKQLLAVDAPTDEKLTFLDNLIKGSYINASGFTSSKNGNVKKHFKGTDKVFKSLFPWLLQWAPAIDPSGVAVGPAEAIFIFTASDGKKGDPAGDVYMDGKVIEMKVSGGSMGKKGETLWTGSKSWFISTVKTMVPALQNSSDAEILKYAPMGGNHQHKSISMNRLSALFKIAGHDDTAIQKFWVEWVKQAIGATLSKKPIVSKGVVDYDSWARYITGCGYVKYKQQTGFAMVCLIGKTSGDYINFVTGEDFMDRTDYTLDASISWTGGGQGGGITARLRTDAGVHPTYKSDMDVKLLTKQYKEIQDIGKLVSQAQKKMTPAVAKKIQDSLKKIKISPRINHTVKLTALLKDPVVRAALENRTKQDLTKWVNSNVSL